MKRKPKEAFIIEAQAAWIQITPHGKPEAESASEYLDAYSYAIEALKREGEIIQMPLKGMQAA